VVIGTYKQCDPKTLHWLAFNLQHHPCYYKMTCVSILLYADDVPLLAASKTPLQQLVFVCENQLSWLDMNES